MQDSATLIAALSAGRAGRLPLVAGPLCLNFTNTASGRGAKTHQDHLKTYRDLLAWSLHAGSITAERAAGLAELARRQQGAARRVLLQAIELREALHAIGTAIAAHEKPPPAAIAGLERAMVRAARAGRLEWDGTRLAWGLDHTPPRLEMPLWPIIRSAGEVLLGGPLDRLKTCAGVNCGWLFLDTTRNGRRRWCEMEVCGSRAKMRRYRHRDEART